MTTHRFGLFFKRMPEGSTGPPISHVYVKTALRYEYPGESPDVIYITPREFGPVGIRSAIDGLIEELEKLKHEVTKRYAQVKE